MSSASYFHNPVLATFCSCYVHHMPESVVMMTARQPDPDPLAGRSCKVGCRDAQDGARRVRAQERGNVSARTHTQHFSWPFPQVSASQGPSDTAPVPEVQAADGPGNGD